MDGKHFRATENIFFVTKYIGRYIHTYILTKALTVCSIYHGQFWGNMKHGKGTLTRPDGSNYRYEGIYSVLILFL